MTIPVICAKHMIGFSHPLEMIAIQRGPVHRSHNVAKGMLGQSEKNQKVFEVINQLNQIPQQKLTKASKDSRLHDSQWEPDQMIVAISSVTCAGNFMHRGKQTHLTLESVSESFPANKGGLDKLQASSSKAQPNGKHTGTFPTDKFMPRVSPDFNFSVSPVSGQSRF